MVLNYLLPPIVFVYLSSIATFTTIAIYTMILVTQWRFRRAHARAATDTALEFRLFLWPYSAIAGLAGLALVIVMMAFQNSTRIAMFVGPAWFAILSAGYLVMRTRQRRQATSDDRQGGYRTHEAALHTSTKPEDSTSELRALDDELSSGTIEGGP